MLKRFIFICSIVLTVVTMPVMAEYGSKGLHGSKDSYESTNNSESSETCGECDGKITNLTLQYNGEEPSLIEVFGHKDEKVFSATVAPNEIFVLEGFDKKDTLGTKITVYINGVLDTEIHTSCSVPLLIGMKFGLFTVKDGFSRNGGQICLDDNPDDSNLSETCGECDGKITNLTLQYNGDEPSLIEVFGHKDEKVFSATVAPNEIFVLEGFDKKDTLGTKITVYISGVLDTEIHTSCSVPILVGMEFGSFTIKDGSSRNGGQVCTVDEYVQKGTVCGLVYEDNNVNGIQDADENSTANISVTVIDENAEVSTALTDSTGKYCAYDVYEGTATVEVNVTTLPDATALVTGENPNNVTVIADTINDAGLDGYIYLKSTAFDQNISTQEDTALSITLTGEDKSGKPLTYNLISQPLHGTLLGTAPNLTYTPHTNYYGTDSFTFSVNNGLFDSDSATVNITITPVNDAPVSQDDNASTDEDTQVVINVLENDSDDGSLILDTLTIAILPTNGAASVNPISGNIVYTPYADYHGVDTLSYTIKDNEGLISNIAIVQITVNSTNDIPVAIGQNLTTPEDTAKVITLTGSDLDGDTLTYSIVSHPTYGTLSGTAPSITYIPSAKMNYPAASNGVSNI